VISYLVIRIKTSLYNRENRHRKTEKYKIF